MANHPKTKKGISIELRYPLIVNLLQPLKQQEGDLMDIFC